LGEKIKKKK